MGIPQPAGSWWSHSSSDAQEVARGAMWLRIVDIRGKWEPVMLRGGVMPGDEYLLVGEGLLSMVYLNAFNAQWTVDIVDLPASCLSGRICCVGSKSLPLIKAPQQLWNSGQDVYAFGRLREFPCPGFIVKYSTSEVVVSNIPVDSQVSHLGGTLFAIDAEAGQHFTVHDLNHCSAHHDNHSEVRQIHVSAALVERSFSAPSSLYFKHDLLVQQHTGAQVVTVSDCLSGICIATITLLPNHRLRSVL
ncbi:hypothetical protein Pelo_4111 [Pelomyxa schiedti]|nr:hypothetical protein Pelo_4111 [Pelomyxa schiedti]